MDRTLWKYRSLDAEAAWVELVAILDEVRRYRGCASLLWHPEFFDAVRHHGYDTVFERSISWLAASGGRALLGREVREAVQNRGPRGSLSPGDS